MAIEECQATVPMVPGTPAGGEGTMVRQERWEEIQRLFHAERATVSEIARRLELDRKTVRRCVAQSAWQPYRRPARTDTLLAEHAAFL